MAEAAVAYCLERIGKLLIWEAKSLPGVISQVHDVQLQLKKLQSFLKDADRKRGIREEEFRWVREVREVALRMEDVLETYIVEVESRRQESQLKQLVTRCCDVFGECITLHKLEPEMKSIQNKLTLLAERKESLKLEDLGESSNAEQDIQELSEAQFSGLIEPYFVGRVKEIEVVVSHLKNEKRVRQVVSVWGMGGLGKTTFARKVYKEVRSHFEASAWVCLSQKFDQLKVLRNILKDLVKDDPNSEEIIKAMDIEQLQQKLHEILTEKKCLVVLDDIWSINHWRKLQGALPYEAEVSGTKILLTTRIQEVAEIGFKYKIEGLTVEEGWKLLSKKAFPTRDNNNIDPYAEDRVDPEKEKIGREIVEKCQGLPLAISALGGVLKGKRTLSYWRDVKLDISSSLISAGDSDEYANVRLILARSYDDLTSRQKQLFLYLGNYGEDEEINTIELYQLWIAEGMVSSDIKLVKGKMSMDVAESYLNELAERSLVQVTPSSYGYPVKFWNCRLHDLIRDLCLIKRKEEDIFNLTDVRDAHSESFDFRALLGEVSALANYVYDGSDTRVPLKKSEYGRVRSLAFAGYQELPQIVRNLQPFKAVRVLSLEDFKFEYGKLPQELCYLIYLRYLSLKGCRLNEVPPFIGDFRYLETLDLRVESESVIMIANVLWKLTRLKHLYLPKGDFTSTSGKLKFVGLDELEALQNFHVSKCEIDDIVKLRRLQVIWEVRVESPQEVEGALKVIASKRRMTDLNVCKVDLLSSSGFVVSSYSSSNYLTQLLESEGVNQLEIGRDVGGSFPKDINTHNFSPNLLTITLEECEYEDDPMPLLEKLPNLRHLTLFKNSYIGTEMVCSTIGFPRLTYLYLSGLPNLKMWSLEKGAMPNLSQLYIRGCEELEMLPHGLKFLKLLAEVNVYFMSEAFNERIKGQDFHKVSHVPSIQVYAVHNKWSYTGTVWSQSERVFDSE